MALLPIRFDEKSFFITILCFTLRWDYKQHYIKNIFQKIILDPFAILDEVHLKCDCIKGSVVNGLRQPILFSFVLYKPLIINYFVSLKQYTINKQTNLYSNTITFDMEGYDHKEVNLYGEKLRFTLQLIKFQGLYYSPDTKPW